MGLIVLYKHKGLEEWQVFIYSYDYTHLQHCFWSQKSHTWSNSAKPLLLMGKSRLITRVLTDSSFFKPHPQNVLCCSLCLVYISLRILSLQLRTCILLFLKENIDPIDPKENQSWIFTGRTDVEAETPILWPPDAKNWLIWKDPDAGKVWRWEEKGTTENEMVGWHHHLNGHEFE